MKTVLIALRRTLSDLAFIAALVALIALIALAPAAGAAAKYPPAGVCDLDGGEYAQLITSALVDAGFVLCEDEAQLIESVARGELDCGVVLLNGLDERIRTGAPHGVLGMITAPTTASESTARLNAAALLYRYAAPYISANVLGQHGVDEAAVLAEYESYFADGLSFSFDISTADEAAAPENVRGRALAMLAAALGLFAAAMYGGAGVLGARFDSLAARVGLRRALIYSALPQLVLRWLIMWAAAALGFAAGGLSGLILPAGAYILALTALSALLTGLLGDGTAQHTLLALMLVGGAALCPVFTDVALLLPRLAQLRWLMPPCWLWFAADRAGLILAAGSAGLLLALGLMCLIKAARGRMRLK